MDAKILDAKIAERGPDAAGDYAVVSPLGTEPPRTRALAPRLDTLEGKTIGQLWNWMFYGDVLYPMIEEIMRERYPGVKFVPYTVFGTTHSATERADIAALPAKLAAHRVDAVISGLGC